MTPLRGALAALGAFGLFVVPVDAVSAAPAGDVRSLELPDGREMRYRLDLPDGFTAEESRPVLVALPPGSLDMTMVDNAADKFKWSSFITQ